MGSWRDGGLRSAQMDYSELSCAYETKSERDDVATFTGIASTDDLDLQNEVIEAGAFDPIARKANGDPDVSMLRDHDRTQVIGGWKSFSQQGRQLHVEGELCLAVARARETYALMKRGYLSGLSVGYAASRDGIKYDTRNGKMYIKKATLKECSIVTRPANTNARVTNVKTDVADMLATCGLSESDIDILVNDGLDALIECKRDPKKPWGDVTYADNGMQEDGVHRYPIHTERNIRAAWSYINMPKNQRPYTSEQVAKIKRRIIAAWKEKIDKEGPPAAQDKNEDLIPSFLDMPMDELRVAYEMQSLLSQLKGRCHG